MRGKRVTRGPEDRPWSGYTLWVPIIVAVFLVSVASCPSRLAAQRPFGATDTDQSAYALGSFALNVIFVESHDEDPAVLGLTEENWTAAQLTNMHAEISQAAAYWEDLTSSYHPNAQLDITVNYVNEGAPLETSYEPITGPGGSSSWINQVMNTQRYYSSSASTNTRNFNNYQRDNLDTNWAATVYVVNDAADDNGKFGFVIHFIGDYLRNDNVIFMPNHAGGEF